MNDLLDEIKKKCYNSNQDCEILNLKSGKKELRLKIAQSKDYKTITLYNDSPFLELLYSSEFENHKLIDGYEAIWSPKNGTIECVLRTINFYGFSISKFREASEKINGKILEYNTEGSVRLIEIPYRNGIKIFIQTPSKELLLIKNLNRVYFNYDYFKHAYKTIPTLKIEGLQITTHEQALNILETIGNSVLFNLDLINEFGYYLCSDKDYIPLPFQEDNNFTDYKEIEPKNEYQKEPLSLYWYAKSARSMPLLQYLAYYQVIEYYFPIYSLLDTQNKVKNLLKDPRFNPDNDTDIFKVLSLVKSSNNTKVYGDERSQLHATIRSCIEKNDIYSFLTNDDFRKEYYQNNDYKKLSLKKISLDVKNPDIISDICERLYDIRCKIVHSKVSNEEFDVILPFSKEVKYISFEIEVIQFIAIKIIISNSRKLSI